MIWFVTEPNCKNSIISVVFIIILTTKVLSLFQKLNCTQQNDLLLKPLKNISSTEEIISCLSVAITIILKEYESCLTGQTTLGEAAHRDQTQG